MWQLKPRLFTLLAELVDLLREHNSLLRESIQAVTKRPAQTQATRLSMPLPRPLRQKPTRAFSAADVTHRGDPPQRVQSDPPLPTPAAETLIDPTVDQWIDQT